MVIFVSYYYFVLEIYRYFSRTVKLFIFGVGRFKFMVKLFIWFKNLNAIVISICYYDVVIFVVVYFLGSIKYFISFFFRFKLK